MMLFFGRARRYAGRVRSVDLERQDAASLCRVRRPEIGTSPGPRNGPGVPRQSCSTGLVRRDAVQADFTEITDRRARRDLGRIIGNAGFEAVRRAQERVGVVGGVFHGAALTIAARWSALPDAALSTVRPWRRAPGPRGPHILCSEKARKSASRSWTSTAWCTVWRGVKQHPRPVLMRQPDDFGRRDRVAGHVGSGYADQAHLAGFQFYS